MAHGSAKIVVLCMCTDIEVKTAKKLPKDYFGLKRVYEDLK